MLGGGWGGPSELVGGGVYEDFIAWAGLEPGLTMAEGLGGRLGKSSWKEYFVRINKKKNHEMIKTYQIAQTIYKVICKIPSLIFAPRLPVLMPSQSVVYPHVP